MSEPTAPASPGETYRFRRHRVRLWLAAAVTLLLVTGATAVAVSTGEEATLRLADTPGSGTPEPTALGFEPNPDVLISPDGTPHVPACRVVGPEDLRQAGMALSDLAAEGNASHVGVSRIWRDNGTTDHRDTPSFRGLSSHCTYTLDPLADNPLPALEVGTGGATRDGMETARTILDEEYDPTGSIRGFTLYEAPSEQYALVKADRAVVFLHRTLPGELDERLLEIAARNFERLLDEPEGPALARYRGSPLDEDVVEGCPLLAGEPIREVTGDDVSPSGKEVLAAHPAAAPATSSAPGESYLYNQCERITMPHSDDGDPSGRGPTFRLTVRAFESEDGAAQHFDSDFPDTIGSYGESFVLSDTGDDAYAGMRQSGASTTDLYVRSGRVTFELTYLHAGRGDTGDLEQRIERLEPLTEHILETLERDGY
ncbi:hypothetical protein [Haloechinothrix sp. LS1_15]|uniref:hypothetical protein n=1 Tax=Haloechinothrix sp. LS1_15 TaxID=2652248 RepID=UPI0029462DC4|nr:hypothetical protein [Haloechinothrix sp. LS1_15]MDV6012318.1 hypothetical protein [Haloechinothrix sp. LS1_15]